MLTKSLRFFISRRETLPISITFKVIIKYVKGASLHVSTVFQQCRVSKGLLKKGFLDICLSMSFGVCNFRSTYALRLIFFFQNVQSLI